MAGLTPSVDKLLALIEHKQDDLVSLTRALVQIPTINPPGDNYADCIELLKSRLSTRGFQIEIIRAEGTPGDTDRYPRLNLIARREGKQAWSLCSLQLAYRCCSSWERLER